jgi:hypothetical protein
MTELMDKKLERMTWNFLLRVRFHVFIGIFYYTILYIYIVNINSIDNSLAVPFSSSISEFFFFWGGVLFYEQII